ncbi:uncharacterized protein LOC129580747 [Paramacrobiotus metropolitanus]|uniref:uncharacterized protein LOC129580747 n=1 Tax=Paramacrobiotus metropolitanus TaxID=2943436 RepID=UPI00244614A8|nr:uncharacterized protein LOC129580747 [Paramacrobiotus metropolitanus]
MAAAKSLQSELATIDEEIAVVDLKIQEFRKRREALEQRKQALLAKVKVSQQRSQDHDWERGIFPWSDAVDKIRTKMGIASFRPLQLSTINVTMANKDCILIMPTGGGKSLCYQIPAVASLRGITVVISPLVSLMEDQFLALRKYGIEGVTFHSGLPAEQSRQVLTRLMDPKTTLRIIYVTPERIAKTKTFNARMEALYAAGMLSRIVIDEVHCCSQWGHDFRPDYKALNILKRQYPQTPILGLTATATVRVLEDVQNILGLQGSVVFRAPFNRGNLLYEVQYKPSATSLAVDKIANLIKHRFDGQSGIVYCLSIKDTEEVAQDLVQRGVKAKPYHASLTPEKRSVTHHAWLNNEISVVVATVAFGMGIDKPDVRFVIHHTISKSIETYYQESGRAGRDGKKSACILFFRMQDAFRMTSLTFTEKVGQDNVREMVRYAHNIDKCRRWPLAQFFGEKWTSDMCDEMCDICKKRANRHTITIDVTEHAKDIVKAVKVAIGRSKTGKCTAAQVIDAWLNKRQIRLGNVKTATQSDCERIIVDMILNNYLGQTFHATAYNYVTYIVAGPLAPTLLRDQAKLEISFEIDDRTYQKLVKTKDSPTAAGDYESEQNEDDEDILAAFSAYEEHVLTDDIEEGASSTSHNGNADVQIVENGCDRDVEIVEKQDSDVELDFGDLEDRSARPTKKVALADDVSLATMKRSTSFESSGGKKRRGFFDVCVLTAVGEFWCLIRNSLCVICTALYNLILFVKLAESLMPPSNMHRSPNASSKSKLSFSTERLATEPPTDRQSVSLGYWDSPDATVIAKIRQKISLYWKTGRYDAAEFWMDKLANLSDYENLSDLLSVCELLFMDGQYAACRNMIETRNLEKRRIDFRYWLGRCYFVTGDLEEALRILRLPTVPEYNKNGSRVFSSLQKSYISENGSEMHIDDICMTPTGPVERNGLKLPVEDDDIDAENFLAAIEILKGKIYDRQDNRQMACAAYQQALEIDPFSVDALEYLASRQALTVTEKGKILVDVHERTQQMFGDEGTSLVDVIYRGRLQPELNWENGKSTGERSVEKTKFDRNPDFLLTKAEYFLQRRDYAKAMEITHEIMRIKPLYRNCLLVHVAALVHFNKSSLLFDLSHRLVAMYPQDMMTWYATAAYYYVCNHMELTRRYLAKAIGMDKSCGHVWLLYGHSFSREREHDQAMAAYFHAVDVMKGSFFPYMYIAREYVRTNNHVLAERFYGEAKQLAPDDPAVLHEIGILHIKKADVILSKNQTATANASALNDSKKEIMLAVENLLHALDVIKLDSTEQTTMDSGVEGILETLATAYMKLRKGEEALKYAILASHINSKNSGVLKIIGMAHYMLGHLQSAVEAFQRALAVNKDDTLTKKMLGETVDILAEEGVAHLLPSVPPDLMVTAGVPRRNRIARAPSISLSESGRSSVKRSTKKSSSVAHTSALNISVPSTSKGVVDLPGDESVAMDISMDVSGTTEREPHYSFLGDFLISGNYTEPPDE